MRQLYFKDQYQKPFLLLLIFLISFNSYSQNFNSKVKAVINYDDSKDDIIEIMGVAKNMTETTYSLYYELSANITSENGSSSKNLQSGHLTLEAYELKSLSTVSVDIQEGVKTIILLLIYDEDDNLLGNDRLVYNGLEFEGSAPEISYKKENEGIVLTGMVTENTKTKAGKDFYDLFYQRYNLSPKKTKAIILVDEQISFGRTTRLMVKVDDKVIYQFNAQPKLDYLKEHAAIAVRQLNKYLNYLENRNEFKKQF